jgi:hypothetical protein
MENLRGPSSVQRLTVTSTKSFEDVVAAFEAAVGQPSISQFQSEIGAAETYEEVELIIQRERNGKRGQSHVDGQNHPRGPQTVGKS